MSKITKSGKVKKPYLVDGVEKTLEQTKKIIKEEGDGSKYKVINPKKGDSYIKSKPNKTKKDNVNE